MAIDREGALARVREATDRFLVLLGEHADATWTRRPDAESWSAAEHAEHVLLSNRLIERVLARGLRPLAPGTPLPPDDAMPSLFARELAPGAREALAAAEPTGALGDRVAALDALREQASGVLRAAGGRTSEELRALGAPHPIFGPFDGVQWLLFAAAHTDQHRGQVEAARLAGAGNVS